VLDPKKDLVQVSGPGSSAGGGAAAAAARDANAPSADARRRAPKVVMGPGTGLGAAQLFWDSGRRDYVVVPGEGSHATFAPRGWRQGALASWAAPRLGGMVEIEAVACGSGLELIYEFLLSDDETYMRPADLPQERRVGWFLVFFFGLRSFLCSARLARPRKTRRGREKKLTTPHPPPPHQPRHQKQTAPEITSLAAEKQDVVAVEAVDMFLSIVGAEAGHMALRCLAYGGVYLAGGILPRLLNRVARGGLRESFLMPSGRERFRQILADVPLYIVTNTKVGLIGSRQVAIGLLEEDAQREAARSAAEAVM
jgi:glucokinase